MIMISDLISDHCSAPLCLQQCHVLCFSEQTISVQLRKTFIRNLIWNAVNVAEQSGSLAPGRRRRNSILKKYHPVKIVFN